jgi:parvulin-like peptidyl-prolyl isomerase
VLRLTLILFFLLPLFNTLLKAQDKSDILASGDNFSITADEFKKRYEFSPHPRQDKDLYVTNIKQDFLKTIIAEKLLENLAIAEGYENNEEFKNNYNYLRKLFLRDVLYSIEVKEKTKIPDAEYAKGRRKIGKTFYSKFIFSEDESEIRHIHKALLKGDSFDSILTQRHENLEQSKPAEITFGVLNEQIEDSLFHLKPGQFTSPVKLKEGWYICKVYSIDEKRVLENSDFEKVERVLKERFENRAYEGFYKRFFKGIVIHTDRELFELLHKKLYDYARENQKSFILKNDKYTLLEPDIETIRRGVNDKNLSSSFIKFINNPISLNAFLEFMKIEGFDFRRIDQQSIKFRLNNYISTFIQNELLAREAEIRGYDKLPEIKNDLSIWRSHFLSSLAMKKIFKDVEVTNDEAYEFFSKNNKSINSPDEIKIAEILTNELEIVQMIFEKLDRGEDFKMLAEKYSLRNEIKENDNEYEFTSVNKDGDLWLAASKLKVGEVYGPINLKEGFSIIKLLERKEGKKEFVESFEDAKEAIKNILRTEKMYNVLADKTADLAVKSDIKINDKVLNELKVSEINMIVYRRFGFGGQNIAVPYTPDFTEWFIKYKELLKSLTL